VSPRQSNHTCVYSEVEKSRTSQSRINADGTKDCWDEVVRRDQCQCGNTWGGDKTSTENFRPC
jgi:hypothetical protein